MAVTNRQPMTGRRLAVRVTLLVAALLAWITPQVVGATTAAMRQSASIPAERKADKVAVLPITGGIDEVSLWSLERRLKAARETGADAVVIELDTPGGEVGAMLDICLRLKSDAPANTVAWVHPKAFSAGTFIALSCREVVVSPGSVFGDAAPIAAVPGMGVMPLPAAERAKQESPLLDELDAAAARRGEDPRLLEAFVAVERELWLIERTADGVRRFADRAELELLEIDPAQIPAKPTTADGPRPRAAADVPLGGADRGAWTMVEVVDQANRLLVVQSDEAMRWGLAEAIVKDDAELRGFFLADTLVRLPEHWSETLVRFLISWPIRILLIGIFIVALVIEGLHPGVGVPGAVAAGALLLLVGAPGLLGLAEWWEILLVLAGIALLGVEILVLPGVGVAGVLGAGCVIFGLVASFTGSDPTSSAERSALLTATTTTVAGLVLGAILVWVSSRWFRETALMRRAVLSAAVVDAHSAPIRGEVPLPGVGARGIADTDLRPSGRAQFGEDVFDAQSTGTYVYRGSQVVVVARNGQSLIVEEVTVQHSASGEHHDSDRSADRTNERGAQA